MMANDTTRVDEEYNHTHTLMIAEDQDNNVSYLCISRIDDNGGDSNPGTQMNGAQEVSTGE